MFLISGNHDSAERLSFGAEIMSQNGVYFSKMFNREPQKVSVSDQFGAVNIYMLPFITPIDVRAVFKDDLEQTGEQIDSYDAAVKKAIDAMHPDYTQRNILVAHQYIKNGERCDGEDSIGGVDDVDAAIVKDFDYVALGHLHRSQYMQYPHIRYSGSPLKYSFSEVNNKKGLAIIELNEKGNIVIRERELIPLHDWKDLRGTYDELMSESFYKGKGYESTYVRITLTDEDDIVEAVKKLRGVYPLLLDLQYDNTRTQHNAGAVFADNIKEKTDMELVSEFFEKQNGQPMNSEQTELVDKLIIEINKSIL